MSTITWTVTVSTTSASVTVPSNTTGPITFASYSNGPVRGQNGWLSNSCGGNDYNANVVEHEQLSERAVARHAADQRRCRSTTR